ncbi:hypothetical protein QBC35DRAFT_494301 [Podospora australis]|uniref:Secreted protein n=1 Tax=Podospora australis TaxID=1536484 RepID=A0AAN6WWV3_9PEZI|nr:hypothetical protein QBC35DRAFT_494301 [Podospora australis]
MFPRHCLVSSCIPLLSKLFFDSTSASDIRLEPSNHFSTVCDMHDIRYLGEGPSSSSSSSSIVSLKILWYKPRLGKISGGALSFFFFFFSLGTYLP